MSKFGYSISQSALRGEILPAFLRLAIGSGSWSLGGSGTDKILLSRSLSVDVALVDAT